MEQVKRSELKGFRGCKGSNEFDGVQIAEEAWGKERANGSALPAMAYLYRRFGPPLGLCDTYKSIADYILTTEDDDVALWITACGSDHISLCIGQLHSESMQNELTEPYRIYEEAVQQVWLDLNPDADHDNYWADRTSSEWCKKHVSHLKLDMPWGRGGEWKSLESSHPVHRLNIAIFNALKELERPTYTRDEYFNIFGRCEPVEEHAEYFGA